MIYLLIGYMWLFIHRPFEVWPELGSLRIELIYMIVTLVCWLGSGRVRWISSPLHLAFGSFALAVLVCWMASPWSGSPRAEEAVADYFKLVVFYVVLTTSIRTEDEFRLILLGFLGSMGLFMAHSFREFLAGRHVYRMDIARMVGVGEYLSDPNSFGASVLCALPIANIGWSLKDRRWVLRGIIGYVVLSILCIVLTGSRTSFAGLLIIALLMVLKSRHRKRRLALTLLAAPLLWFVIPADLQSRFYTLIDPSVGPANAQESAKGRNQGWKDGVKLFEEFPATGCGPGAWLPATGGGLESHVLYAQVIGEMGVLGVLTFGSVLFCLFRGVARIKSVYRRHPEMERDLFYHLADGVFLALISLLFLGLGGHNLYRFSWLWYGAFLIQAQFFLDQRVQQERDAECAP